MDMEGVKLLPALMLLIGVAAMIGGALSLTNTKVGNTMTKCYNSSWREPNASQGWGRCVGTFPEGGYANMTTPIGNDGLNLSNEYYVVVKGQEGIKTGAEQTPTLAIVYVMIIIIGALMSVFAYFKFFA